MSESGAGVSGQVVPQPHGAPAHGDISARCLRLAELALPLDLRSQVEQDVFWSGDSLRWFLEQGC